MDPLFKPCRNGHAGERSKIDGRCLECGRARMKKRYWENPKKFREKTSDWKKKNPIVRRLIRGYPNPTRPIPMYCECCGRLPTGQGNTMHLDHDHVTGKFRGWICHSCNTGIGKLRDNLEGVAAALTYLVRAL